MWGGGKTWRLSPNDPSKYQAFQDWIVNRAESSSGGSGGEERTYTIESLSAIVDGLEVATPPSEEDPVKQLEAIQGWYEKHQEPYRENLQLLAYRIIHTVYLRHLYTMPTLSASDRIQETLHQRVQQGLLDTYHDLERMKKMHGELRVLANSFPDLLSRTIPTAEHDTHEKRQKFVGIKLEMEGLGSYFEARIRRLEETLQELERTLPKDLVRGVKIALREERRPALNAGESHPQVVIISPSDTGDISLRASLIPPTAAPSVLMQPLRAQHDEQQVADSPSTAPPKGGKKSAAAPQEPPSKRQSATASPLPAAARESSSKSSTTPSAQLAPPTAGSSSASASHASLQASRQLAEISEASHSFRKVFKGEQISDLILDPLKSHFERD